MKITGCFFLAIMKKMESTSNVISAQASLSLPLMPLLALITCDEKWNEWITTLEKDSDFAHFQFDHSKMTYLYTAGRRQWNTPAHQNKRMVPATVQHLEFSLSDLA